MEKLVLRVPKWQGELVFSRETLIFVGVIFLMVVGILFCFWGYKFFGAILFMGIGIAACYGSYQLVEPMTTNSVIRMFLTVSLTFMGVCFVYFLSIIWDFILNKLRIRTALAKRNYLLAAPAGAAIIGLTIYYMIWRDEIVAGVIAAVCLVIGLVYQHSKKKKQIRFRSYDDLLRLSRPQFDEAGLTSMAMEDAGTAVSAASVSESEEYVEPELSVPEEENAGAEPYEPEEENAESELYESEEGYVEETYTEEENAESEPYEPEEGYVEETYTEEENAESEPYEPEEGYAEETYTEEENAESEPFEFEEEYIESEPVVSVVYQPSPRPVQAQSAEVRDGTEKEKGSDHRLVWPERGKKWEWKPGRGAVFMALAAGVALIVVGLRFLISNRSSKGGED